MTEWAAPDGLWVFTLAAIRLWALLRVQVLFRRAAGGLAWEAASAVLALVLVLPLGALGAAEGSAGAGTSWAVATGFEFALGTACGLVVSLAGHALVGAAGLGGQVLAHGRVGSDGVTALVIAATGALALALGVHRPLLATVGELVVRWPIG